MRKNLNEIIENREELIKVLNANSKLRAEVLDDAEETEMWYIRDILKCFEDGLLDWSVGFYGTNFIIVKDEEAFLDEVEKANDMYGVLDMDVVELLKERVDISTLEDDEEIEAAREKNEAIAKEAEENLLKFFNNITEAIYEDTYIEDYFVESYIYVIDVEDFEYDEETYELFKRICYVKSYK